MNDTYLLLAGIAAGSFYLGTYFQRCRDLDRFTHTLEEMAQNASSDLQALQAAVGRPIPVVEEVTRERS